MKYFQQCNTLTVNVDIGRAQGRDLFVQEGGQYYDDRVLAL